MFYFLLHIPFIHLLAVIVCYARYGQAHWMFESPDIAKLSFTQPPGWGFSLAIVYLIWMFVVVALYPAAAGLRTSSSAAAVPGSVTCKFAICIEENTESHFSRPPLSTNKQRFLQCASLFPGHAKLPVTLSEHSGSAARSRAN